jgi:hypothetical protein
MPASGPTKQRAEQQQGEEAVDYHQQAVRVACVMMRAALVEGHPQVNSSQALVQVSAASQERES